MQLPSKKIVLYTCVAINNCVAYIGIDRVAYIGIDCVAYRLVEGMMIQRG